MKTLHVDTGEQMQGGQWQALYLVERLQEAILLVPATSPLFQEAAQCGVDVRPLSFSLLRKLARTVDAVHAHDAKAHTWAALSGGAPLMVSRRVAFPVNTGLASRWKYARAGGYLAVSHYVAKCLLAAGIPQSQIQVIYDGALPAPLTSREPGRVVALAAKPVQIPGISVDHTSSLMDDLATASVFVYKSDLEGLGSAAIAAQAAGVPVVASAAGGLPEAVLDGQTGFIVRDGDRNGDFATPVNRLLLDRALAERMGLAGRERVQREFSVDRMVERTMQASTELCR